MKNKDHEIKLLEGVNGVRGVAVFELDFLMAFLEGCRVLFIVVCCAQPTG